MNNLLSRPWRGALLALSFAATQVIAAPGKPNSEWMETSFSIVEVDDAATAYENLVTVHDYAEIPVAWSKWSGDDADTVQYLLNGAVVKEEPASGSGSQSGSSRNRQ